MASPFWDILREWQTFYFIIAGSSASLIGLMFVAVSLASDQVMAKATEDTRIYVTPTLIYFTSALVTSAVLTIPALTTPLFGGLTLLLGAGGMVYCVLIIRRTRKATTSDWNAGDWIFHISTPVVSYVILTGIGLLVLAGTTEAIDALPVAMILLLVSGIRNSWDLALWLASHR